MIKIPFSQLKAIRDAIDCYYNEAPIRFLPSIDDFEEWLSTLLEEDQHLYRSLGMTRCGDVQPFRRYYFEKHGHELDAFLKLRLSEADYIIWLTF